MKDRQQTEEPFVLCACGCGRPTLLASMTSRRAGHVAGQPLEYLRGHRRTCKRTKQNPYERVVADDNGCWIWQGSLTNDGYGNMRNEQGSNIKTHIWFWERKYGPVPRGKELDHTCRKRACGNPDHLEPVTHRENCSRGASASIDANKAVDIFLACKSLSTAEVRARFGVSRDIVKNVKSRRSWAEATAHLI